MNRVFEAVVDIEPILAAASGVPADLDRERLIADLEIVKRDYARKLFFRAALAKRRKGLKALVDSSKKTRGLLAEWEGDFLFYRHVRVLLPTLDAMLADAKMKLKAKPFNAGDPRPIHHAIAELYKVLRHHLGEDAVCIKQGVRGDFVNLAMAALKAMGIDNDGCPFSRKTIANAMRARR